jgi:MYXO-CTERM domain-containing protein
VAVGDVDGDGFADVLVGIPGAAVGRARLFRGTATGPESTPAFEVTGDRGLGAHVAILDADADGFDDVVLATEAIEPASHRIEVYPGGAGGLSTTPAVVFEVPSAYTTQDVPRSVLVNAGDANGDGYEDLVVRSGDPRFGVVLFRGGASGLDTTAAWSSPVEWEDGESAAAVGDTNGDGRTDLVLGSRQAMWLLHGDAGGYVGATLSDPVPNPPDDPPDPVDTDEPVDTDAADTGDTDAESPPADSKTEGACGCTKTSSGGAWHGGLLAVLGLLVRRRRRHGLGTNVVSRGESVPPCVRRPRSLGSAQCR